MRRWIAVMLAVLGFCVPSCVEEQTGEFGAEADYLNDCRPYDLLLQELLDTLSSERVEGLLAQTDDLGMNLPVDEELLGKIEGPMNDLRLFNFEPPNEGLAELGEKRERAYDAAVGAAGLLFQGRDAYAEIVASYDAGEMDLPTRQERVLELLDTYRTARDELEVAERLLPGLLESVGE